MSYVICFREWEDILSSHKDNPHWGGERDLIATWNTALEIASIKILEKYEEGMSLDEIRNLVESLQEPVVRCPDCFVKNGKADDGCYSCGGYGEIWGYEIHFRPVFLYRGFGYKCDPVSDNRDPEGAREENILFAREVMERVRRRDRRRPWGQESYEVAKALSIHYGLDDPEAVFNAWMRHNGTSFCLEECQKRS